MRLRALLASAAVAVSAAPQPVAAQSVPDSLLQIVWAHAPIILQETHGYANEAYFNHLLKVDFDFDWDAGNNASHGDNFPSVPGNRKPTVYYSIVSTPHSYYIGYWFYHIRDDGFRWGCINWPWPWGEDCIIAQGGHDNDLGGYWVQVERNGTPYGTHTISLTGAHGTWFPSHNFSFWEYGYSVIGPFIRYESGSARSERPVYHWWDGDSGRDRPVLFIRQGTHGVWPAQSVPYQSDIGCGGYCGIYPQDNGGIL